MGQDSLRGFELHGVTFRKKIGNQRQGDCPFCGKEGHFYANETNKLWDCKRCGEKGNFPNFLELVAKRNADALGDKEKKVLARDRGLPWEAFSGWGVGWDGHNYTFPITNPDKKVVDLRIYRPGGRAQATPTANLGLFGASNLAKQGPVYVCEGEWDGIAFDWLVSKKLAKEGAVVAVPGASVFKKEWVPWFQNREVIGLYDNDAAGEQGHKKLYEALNGVASSVRIAEWPSGLPEGWDVRDHVKKFVIQEKRPKWAFAKLMDMLAAPSSVGAVSTPPGVQLNGGGSSSPAIKLEPANAEQAIEAYRKWLHLPNDEVLQVMFGAALANKLQGDPIWLFLVAPPGGSKSELLSSLSRSPIVESTTSLTPHSLVSGASFSNGVDPSMIPKLNGKILVIKDFTTILSMHYTSRDEIFGVLRDIYDGRTEKTFGTGIKRAYISHFGIIAGVTPKIEEFGVVHQSLGERFLKYRINTGQKTLSEADRIRRALQNINKENLMRDELCAIGNRCLAKPIPDRLPTLPEEFFEYIVNLAQTCAMMRGVVERDRYTQQVMYKPATEVGTRLAKQLAKLAIGIAIYRDKSEVDWETYQIVRKVALDTAPDRVEEIVRRTNELCPHKGDAAKTSDISFRSRLPIATCFRILQDLELLKLVDRHGKGNRYEWSLSDKFQTLIRGCRLFEKDRRMFKR